jgi:predicted O-methyltransferase YrrM
LTSSNTFRRLLARCVRRVALSLLRTVSEFRALTDVFIPPYASRVDWHSGLGDAVFVLYSLVRAQHPQVIVEIGSARGRSTCALALACRQNGLGRVYAIDPHTINLWTEIGTAGNTEVFLRARLRDYHLADWCEVITATSAEAARTWSTPIDLLFIDGDHTFEGVRRDFELFRPWLTPNALVVFHDTAWNYHPALAGTPPGDLEEKLANMGVPRYLDMLKHEGYQSITLPLAPGLTILDPTPGGFVFCPPTCGERPP